MAKRGKAGGRNAGVTIIRKEEVIAAAHHGGAWKVAYADFVTAMMAFFLLMWLLNATTEDQRKGLADYFSPNNLLSHASSGTGQPFGGHTVFDQGALVSDRGAVQVIVGKRPVVDDPPDDEGETPQTADRHGAAAEAGPAGKMDAGSPGPAPQGPAPQGPSKLAATIPQAPATPQAGGPELAKPGTAGPADATPSASAALAGAPVVARLVMPLAAGAETPLDRRAPTEADLRAAQERQEKQAFEQAAAQLRQAVHDDPALAELSRQLAIDITPQGLRIQLLDEDRLPMFTTGSAVPNDRAKLLLAKVAQALVRLPEAIAVVGHTDAAPFTGAGKSNWELSTERANATRRLLTDAGLPEARISRVTGLADRDPLLPADPLAAANRRIAIIVLRGTTKSPEPPTPPAVVPSTSVSTPSLTPTATSPAVAPPAPPPPTPMSTPTLIPSPNPLPAPTPVGRATLTPAAPPP
jgi:chemotaxis protein MotB